MKEASTSSAGLLKDRLQWLQLVKSSFEFFMQIAPPACTIQHAATSFEYEEKKRK